jgi:uncharacterized damage-inducible protein DinB
MHPRTRQLLDYLSDARDVLSAAVDGVPPDRRAERPAADRWSVAEVLEHLAIVEARCTQIVAGAAAGARDAAPVPDPSPASVFDSMNVAALTDRSTPRARRARSPPTRPGLG